MENDIGHVYPRKTADEREDTVPERKRVAGVDAPVGELAQRAQGLECGELGELPGPRRVKERVALERPGGKPDRHREDRASGGDGGRCDRVAPQRSSVPWPAGHEGESERERGDKTEGERQRPLDEERNDEGGEQDRQTQSHSRRRGYADRGRRPDAGQHECPWQYEYKRGRDGEPKRQADAFSGQES